MSHRAEFHVLLSDKPEPVTPPPELAATVIMSVDNDGTILPRRAMVTLYFHGKQGGVDFSIRIEPKYAYRLGEALCEAGRQGGS